MKRWFVGVALVAAVVLGASAVKATAQSMPSPSPSPTPMSSMQPN